MASGQNRGLYDRNRRNANCYGPRCYEEVPEQRPRPVYQLDEETDQYDCDDNGCYPLDDQ